MSRLLLQNVTVFWSIDIIGLAHLCVLLGFFLFTSVSGRGLLIINNILHTDIEPYKQIYSVNQEKSNMV